MRRVKFPLEKSANKVQYPDDIDYFSSVVIDTETQTVYANYSGNNGTIENSDEITNISLIITVDKTDVDVGEAVTYSGSFDPPLDIPRIPLSLVDREGKHVKNVKVSSVSGIVSGTFKFDKSGDYRITNSGINHHKHIFKTNIKLQDEILIRVSEA